MAERMVCPRRCIKNKRFGRRRGRRLRQRSPVSADYVRAVESTSARSARSSTPLAIDGCAKMLGARHTRQALTCTPVRARPVQRLVTEPEPEPDTAIRSRMAEALGCWVAIEYGRCAE